MIGLPVSTLSGDNIAPQLADLKGRIEAVHLATVENALQVGFRHHTGSSRLLKKSVATGIAL